VKVYLDACAINRLSDDQTQLRIRAEAEAVQEVLSFILKGQIQWSASRFLEAEILRNPNLIKRSDALELLSHAGPLPQPTDQVVQRGNFLAKLGYGVFDALHLAQSEEMQVDALLTTDDRFIKKAGRGVGNPAIQVVNPVDWIKEVHEWLRRKQ
jgi:hypothetical protein